MLQTILFGFGMVLIIEGLAYALAPSFMKDLMRRMLGEGDEVLRIAGFFGLVFGTILIVVAQMAGG